MVKPVVLDFEYKVQNTQQIKNYAPELSFSSILKDTMQKTSEAAYTNYNQTDDSLHHDTNVATALVKDTKEKNYDMVQNESKNAERTFAERRNVQNNEVYVEKQDVMQSLGASVLHTNNKGAIVTDKNALTGKQNVHKKDALHAFKLPDINNNNNNKDQKLFANASIAKNSGKETLHDTINQLQKIVDGQNHGKDVRKSDLKQLIAQLTTMQQMGKKDLHSVVMNQPVIQYNELSDNKNKKMVQKSGNDIKPQHAGDNTHKTVKNSETTLLDAVKQKGRTEESSKLDKNLGQATERHDSFIQVNAKHNVSTSATVTKPVVQEQLMLLLNKAKVIQEGEKTSLSLKLYPESLGKLSVNLGVEHGILSGRFIVESHEAKELLLQQLESIRWELEHNGVQVGEFEVNVKEHRQREYTEMPGLSHKQTGENAEYEVASNRYIYHDGLLDVII
ncbi:MAG: flagellar hook-length control protein FliK [Spirochaetota bacterium]